MINQRRTPVSKIAEWTVAAAVPYALRMSAYSPSLLLLLALAACTAANKDETASDPSSSAGTTTATTAAGSDTATTGQPGSVSQTDPDPTTDPTTDPPTGSDSSGPPTTDTNNTTTDTSDTNNTTTGVPAVSFTDVFEQVILPNGCNAGYCHGGGAGGLEMTDEATTYANLVEVKAVAALCDQSMRVVPGAPDESILWIRARPAALDAMAACADGTKMPKASMGLAADQAQLLSDWIAGGALE